MPCFVVPYRDRFGEHETTKWGNDPAEARALVRTALSARGVGAFELGTPYLLQPQPFSDEARAAFDKSAASSRP